MQQSDENAATGAHVSALTLVVQTLLAHALALNSTQEMAEALVARLRRASRHVLRFVADDHSTQAPYRPTTRRSRSESDGLSMRRSAGMRMRTVEPAGRAERQPETLTALLGGRMATYAIQVPQDRLSDQRKSALPGP